MCEKHVRNVYVFRLSFHFAYHPLVVGKVLIMLISVDQKTHPVRSLPPGVACSLFRICPFETLMSCPCPTSIHDALKEAALFFFLFIPHPWEARKLQ